MTSRNDTGMTLPELAIALSLMVVVIAAGYAGFLVTQRGAAVAQGQAHYTNDIATPMQLVEKALTQNISIDNGTISGTQAPTRYYLSFLTDVDGNNQAERYVIQAKTPDASGLSMLTLDVYSTNVSRQNVALTRTDTLSTTNVNRSENRPLFTYYSSQDASGTIADMTQVPANARSLAVNFYTRFQASKGDPAKTLHDSRRIFFRNR